MSETNILAYVLIFLVMVLSYKIYEESDMFQLKCIVSDVDGNRYCVRERNKLELAADLLAQATEKCKELVRYVGKSHPDNEDVKRLVKNFNPKTIQETLPTSALTAYSENKGEKIAFCLNTTKEGNKLIDIHTLTFVAIHEISHIMTESVGHKPEFWANFKFLLENAKKANIYDPVDYKKNPQQYCGMTIKDNPYYDF
jgi:hypothetical protein|uniref:Uncharacterized protein n=1 Tax=viral metagenome TaxID=1070528 RepID=A0A6C0LUU5_9ZZZZ|tara:strand:+ start:2321 stop:2914 length:594 start_codon:yes stop_codon:yes gene_type:complete